MWRYFQATGELLYGDVLVGIGYAGGGVGKNNPADEFIVDCGPLPRGWYTIGAAYTDPVLGPFAMKLTPDAGNVMEGRGDFYIHADSIAHPGNASEGCMVQAQCARVAVAIHPDRRLEVL